MIALGAPAVASATDPANVTIKDKIGNYVYRTSGVAIDGSLPFNTTNAVTTIGVIVAGCLVSKYGGRYLGVNRYLPKGISI